MGMWRGLGIVGLLAAPALAGPPPTDGLSRQEADILLRRLVFANVAASNCAGFEVTNSEWKFITDIADQVANEIGLDSVRFEEGYYAPAFESLEAVPEFCAMEGPKVRPLIEEMILAGGTVEKYKPGG